MSYTTCWKFKRKKIEEKTAASCPNVGQKWGAKHSALFKFLIFFWNSSIFQKFSFSNPEQHFSSILIVPNKELILFHIEKLTFILSINFKNFNFFRFSSFSIKKLNRKNYFRKSFAIFRRANNCLNEDYKRYLLPPKWVWTNLFVRWSF